MTLIKFAAFMTVLAYSIAFMALAASAEPAQYRSQELVEETGRITA